MSVRESLLAILDQGPCYGYQLRDEYRRRTGAHRALNVGQVYATLERLERDEQVLRLPADEAGHVYWQITPTGHQRVAAWFGSASSDVSAAETVAKVALAATLPGVDAVALIAMERDAATEALPAPAARQEATAPSLAAQEQIAALVERAEAEQRSALLRWLDEAQELLQTQATMVMPLSQQRPRRGRPPVAAS